MATMMNALFWPFLEDSFADANPNRDETIVHGRAKVVGEYCQ